MLAVGIPRICMRPLLSNGKDHLRFDQLRRGILGLDHRFTNRPLWAPPQPRFSSAWHGGRDSEPPEDAPLPGDRV